MRTEMIAIALCLLFHGLFAGTEMALVSCSRIRMRHLAQRGHWRAALISRLKAHPESFLGTTLVGVNIVIISESVLANRLLTEFSPRWSSLLTTLVMVPLVLIFGEVLPKTLFHRYADQAALVFVVPLRLLYLCLFPLVKVFTEIGKGIARLFGIDTGKARAGLSREEIQILVGEAGRVHDIREEDRLTLQRIFKFKETTARKVMVPLEEVDMSPVDATVETIRELVFRTGRSRIPLHEKEDRTKIVGYVRATELAGLAPDLPISRVLLQPHHISHQEPIRRLLRVFQTGGRHLAIVHEDSGAAVGIITLEDVIEEIVGEIEDEYDVKATAPEGESGFDPVS